MGTVAPSNAITPAVNTLIRYVLTAVGTLMVSHGFIDQGTADTLVGAMLVIIPVAYGVYTSYHNSKTIKEAEPYTPDFVIKKQ